jgi:hypothetical protein
MCVCVDMHTLLHGNMVLISHTLCYCVRVHVVTVVVVVTVVAILTEPE